MLAVLFISQVCNSQSTPSQKDQIILYDLQRAFAVDSLTTSHPLSQKEEEVNTPSEISEMFNTISYSKVQKSSCA